MPVLRNVREIVVTGEDTPELDGVDALSGKEVAVGQSTSYYESLTKLSERLTTRGKPPVTTTIVPDTPGVRRPDGDDSCRVVACHRGR
jgi:hypothetical protein